MVVNPTLMFFPRHKQLLIPSQLGASEGSAQSMIVHARTTWIRCNVLGAVHPSRRCLHLLWRYEMKTTHVWHTNPFSGLWHGQSWTSIASLRHSISASTLLWFPVPFSYVYSALVQNYSRDSKASGMASLMHEFRASKLESSATATLHRCRCFLQYFSYPFFCSSEWAA